MPFSTCQYSATSETSPETCATSKRLAPCLERHLYELLRQSARRLSLQHFCRTLQCHGADKYALIPSSNLRLAGNPHNTIPWHWWGLTCSTTKLEFPTSLARSHSSLEHPLNTVPSLRVSRIQLHHDISICKLVRRPSSPSLSPSHLPPLACFHGTSIYFVFFTLLSYY